MTAALLSHLDLLDEKLKVLDRDERFVLISRFGLFEKPRLTLQQVGELLLINREGVRQLQNVALGKLRRAIREEESVRPKPETLLRTKKSLPHRKTKTYWRYFHAIPQPKYIEWANQTIGALEAFKQGLDIQMRGELVTNGQWQDFDLAHQIDNGMVSWRIKPIRKQSRNGHSNGGS